METAREEFWESYLVNRSAWLGMDRKALPLMDQADLLAQYDGIIADESMTVAERNLALGVVLENAIVPR